MACVTALGTATAQAQAGAEDYPEVPSSALSKEEAMVSRSQDPVRARRLKRAGAALLALSPVAAIAIGGGMYAADRRQETECDSPEAFACFDLSFGYGFYQFLGVAYAVPLVAAGAVLVGLGRRRLLRLERYAAHLAVTRDMAWLGVSRRF